MLSFYAIRCGISCFECRCCRCQRDCNFLLLGAASDCFLSDVDFEGYDLPTDAVEKGVRSPRLCQEHCGRRFLCKYWTWAPKGGGRKFPTW